MSPAWFCARTGVMVLGVVSLIACAPTGDFGRVQQSPGVEISLSAPRSEDGTRTLVLTDEERLMKSKIHRFVSFSQNQSWTGIVMQSVRAQSGRPQVRNYYDWLRKQDYASSPGRYRRILNDIELDRLTLPSVYEAICAVNEIDRRRAIALTGLSQPDPEAAAAGEQRRLENSQAIGGFVDALVFRYDSYAFALEQLLVDTPHEEARTVDARLNKMAASVAFARAGQFCSAQ